MKNSSISDAFPGVYIKLSCHSKHAQRYNQQQGFPGFERTAHL